MFCVTHIHRWLGYVPTLTGYSFGQKNAGEYQAYSEYKHVLANILRSLFVARTPPVDARSPDCRSNVENAPRRPPVAGARRPRPAGHSHYVVIRGMDASL